MSNVGRAIVVLGAVWVIALGIMFLLRQAEPTPEKIVAYLEENPIAEAGDRHDVLTAVAGKLNGLDFEERQRLQRSGTMRTFYEQMTEAERMEFLDLTLPEGFRQVMLALNKMTPEKRQEMVDRALRNMEEQGTVADRDAPDVDEELMKKFVSEGMNAFYEEANADVKLDFAPVIEQIQQSLQWR